jgi:hypothetical protein
MIRVEKIDFSDENHMKDREFVFEKFSDFRIFLDKEQYDVFENCPIGVFKKDATTDTTDYEINNRICFIEKNEGEFFLFHTSFKLLEGFEYFNSYTYSGDLNQQMMKYIAKERLKFLVE